MESQYSPPAGKGAGSARCGLRVLGPGRPEVV